MAFVNKRENGLVIALSKQESAGSGLEEGKRYDLSKLEDGKWLLTSVAEKEQEKKLIVLEQKITELVSGKELGERVEGKFESLLSKEELPVFKKMVEDGKIVPFKLNEKYKKAVYKLSDDGGKESEKPQQGEKPIEEYSLEKDGIMVVRNEHRAKKICEQFAQQIKEGKIKGIKSFDGHFYIIEEELYNKYREKAINTTKECEEITLEELAEKINVSKVLARILSEFLKDEGEIIEKSKEKYRFICED